MFNLIQKAKRNKKGFTLIELIVVIAILGIIALIAIPRFAGIQQQARLDADTSTARQIMNVARIIDSVADEVGGHAVTSFDAAVAGSWEEDSIVYMVIPEPRTGGSFSLSYADPSYSVSFGEAGAVQTVTEGTE